MLTVSIAWSCERSILKALLGSGVQDAIGFIPSGMCNLLLQQKCHKICYFPVFILSKAYWIELTSNDSRFSLPNVFLISERYKHSGQFSPLGGEQTAAQLPGDWISIGHSSRWLWYSVYTMYYSIPYKLYFRGLIMVLCFHPLTIPKTCSKQVSWRTRALVVSDWTRRFIFGRDSSRI